MALLHRTESTMKAKIILIGEAFGENEDNFKHGFVGSSGTELVRMLGESGLAPMINIPYPSPLDLISYWKYLKENNGILITNVFEARPPDNHLYHFFDDTSKDTFMPPYSFPKMPQKYVKPEHRHHIENLYLFIKDQDPNLCILLGNCASWAVSHQTQISKIRGTFSLSKPLNVKCLSTFHPSYIIQGGWSDRNIVINDFDKCKKECEFPEIRRVIRKAWLNCTLDEIRAWLSLPADHYTIDIESGYALFTPAEIKNMTPKMRSIISQQISMIGFARNPTDAMVIEFLTRKSPNLSYWKTKEEEIEAWRLAKQGVQRPIPKTFQNGLYDMVRMLYAGIPTAMAKDDTMLLHHSLYPEMLKGLGFLGSLYSNEAPWKIMYSKGETLKKDE